MKENMFWIRFSKVNINENNEREVIKKSGKVISEKCKSEVRGILTDKLVNKNEYLKELSIRQNHQY